MFDEYDEGTAIAKMSDSYFAVPVNQYFLTSSADGTYVSSNFYLRLVGKATQTIKGEIPLAVKHSVSLQDAPIWFRTSFEPMLDAQPIISSTIKSGVKVGLSSENAVSGKWSLKVSGKTSGFSVAIFDVEIQVSENTILTYQIYPVNKTEKIASIELLTTDGSIFNAKKISGELKMNEWNKVSLNIGHQLKGKTVSKIAVGCENTFQPESFTSFIDNISIFDGKPDQSEMLK
jgi:hypothetical protein